MPRPPHPEKLRKITVRIRERDHYVLSQMQDMNESVREAVSEHVNGIVQAIEQELDGYEGGDPTMDKYQEIVQELHRKEARGEFRPIHFR